MPAIAHYVAVWEVRMCCRQKHIPSQSALAQEQRTAKEDETFVGAETEFQRNLKGAEIVYQHKPSQTVEFHTAETRSRGLLASGQQANFRYNGDDDDDDERGEAEDHRSDPRSYSVVDDVEQIQSEIEQLAYSSVRSKSWCRMFVQHHLLFISLVSIGILACLERFQFSKSEYLCLMKSQSDDTCGDKASPSSTVQQWKSLVTSAEIIRCYWIYVFMGLLSSYKNAWLLNTQRTGIACVQRTKDDVYMSAYQSIAHLPRAGMHHHLVGQTIPFVLALLYSIMPFPLRQYKNYRHLATTANMVSPPLASSSNVFSHIVGASYAGESESTASWDGVEIIIACICLSGFSVMVASVLR